MPIQIKKWQIHPFKLPLISPLRLQLKKDQKESILWEREGFLLEIQDESGKSGFGEYSPLPGFHANSINFKNGLSFFKNHGSLFFQSPLIKDLKYLQFDQPLFNAFLNNSGLYKLLKQQQNPLLFWPLEQALLTLSLQIHSPSSSKFISSSLNALLFPQNQEKQNREKLKEVAKNGYQTFKIKIGRDLPEEIAYLNLLLQEDPGNRIYRFDGNSLMEKESYLQFYNCLKKIQFPFDRLEYIEDPLYDKEIQRKIFNECPLPLGMDESFFYYFPQEFSRNLLRKSGIDGLRALIIKPSLCRGIHQTIQLLKNAKQNGLKGIMSSTFESGWTHRILVFLAALFAPEESHGLDPYFYLKEDLLKKKLEVEDGRIILNPEKLNMASIKESFLLSPLIQQEVHH